jgi:hypothetical protein
VARCVEADNAACADLTSRRGAWFGAVCALGPSWQLLLRRCRAFFSIIIDLPARLLKVGVDAAATATIGLAVRAAYCSVAGRWAQEREYRGQFPVAADEAVARARWLIIEDYGLDPDAALGVIGEESQLDGGMTVRLRGDGKDWTCQSMTASSLWSGGAGPLTSGRRAPSAAR